MGGGSEGFGRDGRLENGAWEKGRERGSGCRDIRGWLGGERKVVRDESEGGGKGEGSKTRKEMEAGDDESKQRQHEDTQEPPSDAKREEANPPTLPSSTTTVKAATPPPLPQIFHNLAIYLNGSTLPLISDHKLKTLFVAHGGSVCLGLARRTVTHVILGDTGLAAGKIQKEVRNIRGEKVKYVTAQWVVDSVKSGRRKGEGAYLPNKLGIGGRGRRGVGVIFGKEVKDR